MVIALLTKLLVLCRMRVQCCSLAKSMPGTAIQFAGLDTLLWGVVATIEYYTLPAMALSIAGIGIGLIMSGDDIERKSRLKHWVMNILVGGLLVFGASALATVLKGFFGGQ